MRDHVVIDSHIRSAAVTRSSRHRILRLLPSPWRRAVALPAIVRRTTCAALRLTVTLVCDSNPRPLTTRCLGPNEALCREYEPGRRLVLSSPTILPVTALERKERK